MINNDEKEKSRKWQHYNKCKPRIGALESEKLEKIEDPPKAVLFVQYTKNGELASDLRKVVQDLRPWTKLNLKIVERSGQKLQDLLCKSNPWDSTDCGRDMCFTCTSSAKDEKSPYKSCFKRSIVYETWCNSCLLKSDVVDQPIVDVSGWLDECGENRSNSDPSAIEVKRKFEADGKTGPYYRYIGESSRSVFERGGEHLKDLDFRRPKSHLLRHCVEEHQNIAPENVDFRMKVLSVHRSAFERQIREAVVLDYVASPLIMNSKLEYTRCGIPKMELRLGNKEIEERKGVAKEKDTIEKIKMLYKGENKRTKKDDDENMDGRGGKRKKMDLPP